MVPKGPAKSYRILTLGREELKKPLSDCKHKLFSKIIATKHGILPKCMYLPWELEAEVALGGIYFLLS